MRSHPAQKLIILSALDRTWSRAGIFKQSMGGSGVVIPGCTACGIGSLESILGLHKSLKIRALLFVQYNTVHQCHPKPQWRDFFPWAKTSWLMMVADCPLLGQSASGLNFYDDSGRSPLAD
jgi:hypothetical protein